MGYDLRDGSRGTYVAGGGVMEWQPIETAPKDGVTVLVYMDGDVFQGQYKNNHWIFPFSNYHGCGCCSEENDSPSYWMPLPSPPKGHEE